MRGKPCFLIFVGSSLRSIPAHAGYTVCTAISEDPIGRSACGVNAHLPAIDDILKVDPRMWVNGIFEYAGMVLRSISSMRGKPSDGQLPISVQSIPCGAKLY